MLKYVRGLVQNAISRALICAYLQILGETESGFSGDEGRMNLGDSTQAYPSNEMHVTSVREYNILTRHFGGADFKYPSTIISAGGAISFSVEKNAENVSSGRHASDWIRELFTVCDWFATRQVS